MLRKCRTVWAWIWMALGWMVICYHDTMRTHGPSPQNVWLVIAAVARRGICIPVVVCFYRDETAFVLHDRCRSRR